MGATVTTVGTGVGSLVGAQRGDSELGVAVVVPPLGAGVGATVIAAVGTGVG